MTRISPYTMCSGHAHHCTAPPKMASLGSYLPEEGRAVWRRDRQPEYTAESKIIRHVVIRGTELKHDPSTHVVRPAAAAIIN